MVFKHKTVEGLFLLTEGKFVQINPDRSPKGEWTKCSKYGKFAKTNFYAYCY